MIFSLLWMTVEGMYLQVISNPLCMIGVWLTTWMIGNVFFYSIVKKWESPEPPENDPVYYYYFVDQTIPRVIFPKGVPNFLDPKPTNSV